MKLVQFAIPLACVAAIAACNRPTTDRDRDRTGTTTGDRPTITDRPGETTVTGANVVNNQQAIDRLVQARCDREASCSNIGTDKRFGTRDVCSRDLAPKVQDDLKASECPKGIDGKNLDECLSAIRKESCGNPLETLSRLAACNSPQLCLDRGDKPSTR